MIDNKIVGQAISRLRQVENMTQQTLAACLNVSHQAVSKWENGAALPDVLTLLEISRMFGVTLEQLLAGDIENRLEKRASAPAEAEGGHPIELKLDGAGLSARANDAIKEAEDAVQNEDKNKDAEKKEEKADEDAPIDMEKIIQMAPFMSKAALEELIEKYSGKCSPRELSRLAPFVSSECLEKLIVNSESEINWDTLRRLAPFLKKEAVDALTMAVAKGEKYVRPAAKTISKSITFGINKAIEIAKSVGAQMNGEAINVHIHKQGTPKTPASPKTPAAPKAAGRASEARRRIFERALADEKFDWIAEHMDQLEDAELKAKIAARARELGMTDWIQENMGDVMDQATIDDALLSGNWDYIADHICDIDEDTLGMIVTTALTESRWDFLGEHLSEMELTNETTDSIITSAVQSGQWDFLDAQLSDLEPTEEAIQTLLNAAADAGKWDFLSAHIDEFEIDECAFDLAKKAYEGGARDLAIILVDEYGDGMDLSALIGLATEKDDTDFVEQVLEHADEETVNETCLKLARAGKIGLAAELAENADEETVAELIEIATEKGDWSAIDRLNEYL